MVGVDPAAAMLDVARNRPGGSKARWIEADARTVRLNQKFDLVLLTGHAFQVFLTRRDRASVLKTIASHLNENGRFIFDTRNPLIEDLETWKPDATRSTFEHPELGTIELWNDVSRNPQTGIVTYETHYRCLTNGELYSAPNSNLAFPAQGEIAGLITDAGLKVLRWYGDWHGGNWTARAPEIIPFGKLA